MTCWYICVIFVDVSKLNQVKTSLFQGKIYICNREDGLLSTEHHVWLQSDGKNKCNNIVHNFILVIQADKMSFYIFMLQLYVKWIHDQCWKSSLTHRVFFLPQFVIETKDKLQVQLWEISLRKLWKTKWRLAVFLFLVIVPVQQLNLSDGGGHQCFFIVCVSEQLSPSSKILYSFQSLF